MAGRPTCEEMVFGRTLAALGEEHPNLVVLDADLGRATETDFFKKACPGRYFDLGIAEQNMVGIAAGLALSGKKVFAGTFACFITKRCADQVSISVAYCDADVKLMGVEAGLASGRNGASHQGVEDLAIMRAIPNMTVIVPADATETKAVLRFLMSYPKPTYMRVHRGAVPVVLNESTYGFRLGHAATLADGRDVTIVAAGIMVAKSLAAAARLSARGIRARVLNMSSIKPLDAAGVVEAAEETGAIVTAENHSVCGGLGAAVAETACEMCPVPVVRVGIPDSFGEVGTIEYLERKYGLDVESIERAVDRALDLKARNRN